jgi:uncharacterized cupredoxin-like copper-binding protein
MRRKSPRSGWGTALTAALVVSALVLAACGGDDDGGGGDGGGGTVDVTLQEFAVNPAQDSVPAGSVTFQVENTGPEDVHEFVVIKTDLAPDALPTDDTGAVEETGEGMEVITEIEDIPVGETQTVTADLEAGSYALICNIYDEEEQEAHYQMGMRIAFTVT